MDSDPTTELELESELLARIGRGDQESFARLYERLSGILFHVISRILKDHETAEDVLQEVFLQIWEKAPLYDPSRGKPTTWAVVLARNRAIDRLRSIQRRYRAEDALEMEEAGGPRWDDRDSLNAVASTEAKHEIREALLKLSADQRKVLELAFFQSLTHTEISEHLALPLGTVKARLRRGMLKLRTVLTRNDG